MTKSKQTKRVNIAFHREDQQLDGVFERIPESDTKVTLTYLPKGWTAIVYDESNIPQFSTKK
jgi:hypothetical protein